MSITVDGRAPVGVITLDRPETHNAITPGMLDRLSEAFDELGSDASVDGIVLQGNGSSFSAGGDLSTIKQMEEQELTSFADQAIELTESMEQLEKPVIAAIDGGCIGGGLGLALACDLRYASPRSRFAHPETGVGMVPLFGATVRLPAAIGMTRAKAMMLAGTEYEADTAASIGLITTVVQDPLEQARTYIRSWAQDHDAHAFGLTKAMLHQRHRHGRELDKDISAASAVADTEALQRRIERFFEDT